MTLCIAASCELEKEPAIVICCDERRSRGLVSSDDSYKIRYITDGAVVLLAGERTAADELYLGVVGDLKAYTEKSETDELDITRLIQSLKESVRKRWRAIMGEHLVSTIGLSYDEFLNFGKSQFIESHYTDIWTGLRMLNLGAELIVATFGQDESVLMRIGSNGNIAWEDHYSAIGTGHHIADSFLCQRPYDDFMSMDECLYRVVEAKKAAERNRDVGPTTILQVLTQEREMFTVNYDYYRSLEKAAEKRLYSIPKLKAGGRAILESLDDSDDTDSGEE